MKSFLTLLIVIISSTQIQCALKRENVLIAINCGGEDYRGHNGIYFQKDTYFKGGQTSDFGTNFPIKLTKDEQIYQTERWSSEDLEYEIPIANDGDYVLNLKFSEVYFNSPGEKIFDILIGRETVLKQLDIYTKVGKATALDEYIEFQLKNNNVYFKGKLVVGGYDEDNKVIRLILKKGEIDNPKINAIVLIKGTIEDTDYSDFKNRLEEFEREKSEKEKKQREFQKISKSIDYEDFEDDYVDDGKLYIHNSQLFSKEYILLFALIGVASYFLFFRKGKHSHDD